MMMVIWMTPRSCKFLMGRLCRAIIRFVVMVYRGNGFGIFHTYAATYSHSEIRATFHAEEGKRIQVSVVGYEKGGMTTDLKDRPDIRFENKLTSPGRAPGQGPQLTAGETASYARDIRAVSSLP